MIGKTIEEIAFLLGERSTSKEVIKGFAVDSRKVIPGSIFFAMKGEKVDGHDFLEEAFNKGAICAVVHKRYKGKIKGLDLIFVEDVLRSLQTLAKMKMLSQKTRCIGITGSVGKTTTKEFLATLLEGSFKIGKTPGNENSQVGV
ncbi:MAG: UDP-N-acetylmuramoyl-tripeptide--D-alanyl-D-alanine ligase, partial [Verrucomicrobia bacterium]|nr:UDP-N-acetylmuramoyl-tripeptide--D-alanyl-D-alanine ligase [Verrucomicrobiota bacterium]